MRFPDLRRLPERPSYSNGPNITLVDPFGWLSTGLRRYHNMPRNSEFRVEMNSRDNVLDSLSLAAYKTPHDKLVFCFSVSGVLVGSEPQMSSLHALPQTHLW